MQPTDLMLLKMSEILPRMGFGRLEHMRLIFTGTIARQFKNLTNIRKTKHILMHSFRISTIWYAKVVKAGDILQLIGGKVS